jgi:hypothetical protein
MPVLEEQDELSVIPATRSPHGYLASQLSDNIHQREDGSLIIVGCPVARTGWQEYLVKNLPQKLAAELGVDVSNPNASINLYRPHSEVFHPDFLASLNGVPVCDNHPPAGEFVNKDNHSKYSMGHLQNVRKGTEPLEDGEWPIIADIIIAAEPLVSKVLSHAARENSLGYDFSIRRDGDKIIQCQMVGNHDAVVQKGRAGEYVRIEDAALELEKIEEGILPPLDSAEKAEVTPKFAEAEQSLSAEITANVAVEEYTASVETSKPSYTPIVLKLPARTKEKQTVAKKNPWYRSLMGKHLIESARATDADPEKIMDLAESLHEEEEDEPVEDKKAKDGEVPPELKENEFKPKAEDSHRKRLHDALDRALDSEADEPVVDKRKAKDADIEELKSLMDEFLSEEKKEPEHAEDDEMVDTEPLDKELAADEELCEECKEPIDDCKCTDSEDEPGEEVVESGEEELEPAEDANEDDDLSEGNNKEASDRSKAKDRARATDAASAVLRVLRPAVARSNDKAVQKAFNAALRSITKASTASTSSYGGFAGASRARDAKATSTPNPYSRARASDSGAQDPIRKMQDAYDNAFKGGK